MFDSLQRDAFSPSDEIGSRAEQAFSFPAIQPANRAHDEGLTHNHGWASAHHGIGETRPKAGPIVADARNLTTPSCALHDDIHYAN